ncbi:DUF6916 family protein [Nocardioides panacisoli]|uniref:DUF6916 domain-containing protein n=1 Tax=Nocardioides panacisoli TaxID=627624 RepID=A0ABP7IZ25_9ACTN
MAATPWLTYADFTGLVGEVFTLALPDGRKVPLTVEEVSALGRDGGAGPDGTPREQFSVVFLGPSDPLLGQGTQELSHGALGDLALFLVPIGADADGVRYEAVFA